MRQNVITNIYYAFIAVKLNSLHAMDGRNKRKRIGETSWIICALGKQADMGG
jgi:hypothetical protein